LLERLFALEHFGIKLGLENVTRLCEALGHPERSFASLHVGGTNGKGSVTAMTHASLLAAGIRAGRYISPHLVDLSERYVVGPAPVDSETLHQVADDVLSLVDRLRADNVLSVSPTFFEVTTVMAFEIFRRAGIDVAVIEVGLGGRFDATNVIMPVAGAITTIGFDHQQHLGTTLEAIAFEKAGIIKPGMTTVSGDLPAAAAAVVRRVADERHARLIEASRDVLVDSVMAEGRARFSLRTPHGEYGPVQLSLRGAHQVANAIVAVRLLEAAQEGGVPVTREAIERGLATTEWPARLEVLPVDANKRVVIDAAHNVDGAEVLAAYLRQWHEERPALVVSIMRDKDVGEILKILVPAAGDIYATLAPSPRATPLEHLVELVSEIRPESREHGVFAIADPMAALEQALARHDVVCVAGSIFLAGAVRDALMRRAILR
jgi:dihydrofolate synthase/folylpolyglutamate synthase